MNRLSDRQIAEVSLVTTIVALGLSMAALFITIAVRSDVAELNNRVRDLNADTEGLAANVDRVDDQVKDVQAALDSLIAPSPEEPPPPELEFVSAIAAASNVTQMVSQSSYIYYSDGDEATQRLDLLVPIVRHEATGLCLWVDNVDLPTTMVTRDCGEIRDEVRGASRDDFPLYYGWHFEQVRPADVGGVVRRRWHLCFAGTADPREHVSYFEAMHCLDQDAIGVVSLAPAHLVPSHSAIDQPSVAFVQSGSRAEIWAWGDNGDGSCLAVDSSSAQVVPEDGPACAESLFSLALAQWLVYRTG